jgi:hypothetical protein
LTRLAPILILSPAFDFPVQNSMILNILHFFLDSTTLCLILLFQIPKKKKFFVSDSNNNNNPQLSKEQTPIIQSTPNNEGSFTSSQGQHSETQENANKTNGRQELSSDPTTDKKASIGTEDSSNHSNGAKDEEKEGDSTQKGSTTNKNSDSKSDLNSSNSSQNN